MTNEEHNLFNKLFQFVDKENKGRLNAQEAANFLKRSNLPKETLKQIYIIAAQTSTQFLDRDDFYIALRLVALAQNNLPFTKNSIIVNNPIPPLPVFNLQQNENDVNDIEQVFKLEEIDKEKYRMLFDKNKELPDKISISKSYQMWKSLDVHDTVIQKILTIVQPLQDKSFLNVKEFQVILHLIIKGAKNEIPKVLPQCIAGYLRGGFNQQQNNMNAQMQMPQQQQQPQMQRPQQQSQINPQIQMQPQIQLQQPTPQINQQMQRQQPQMNTQIQMQHQQPQPQMQMQMNQQQPQLQPPTQMQMQMPQQQSQMNLHMQQQPQINSQMQQQQQQPQMQMYQQQKPQQQQQPVKKDIDILLMNMDCGLPQQQPQQPTTSLGPYLPQQQQQQPQHQPEPIQNILPNQGNQYQPQNFQQFPQQQQIPQQYQPSPLKPEDDKSQASSILLEQIEKELRNYNDLTYQNDCLQTQLHNIKEKIKLCKEQLVKAALAITNQNDEIKKANNELTEVKNQLQITIIERERYEETYFKEKAYINQQLQEKQELLRKNQEELQFNQLEHEQIQQKKLLEEEEIEKLRNMEKNNTQQQQQQQQNQNKQQVDFEQMNYEDFLNFPSTNDLPIAKDSDFPSTNDNNNNAQMNMNNDNNNIHNDNIYNNDNNNNNNIRNDIQQQQQYPSPPQNMQFNFGNVDNDFQIETNQQQNQQHQIEEPDFGFHIDIPQSNEKVINPYEEDDTNFNNDDNKKQTLPNQFNANISPITSTNFNPNEMNFHQIEQEQNPGHYTIFPSFGSLMRDSKENNATNNPPNFQFEYFNAGNTAFQDFQQKKSNDNFQMNINNNNNNNNNNFDDFDF